MTLCKSEFLGLGKPFLPLSGQDTRPYPHLCPRPQTPAWVPGLPAPSRLSGTVPTDSDSDSENIVAWCSREPREPCGQGLGPPWGVAVLHGAPTLNCLSPRMGAPLLAVSCCSDRLGALGPSHLAHLRPCWNFSPGTMQSPGMLVHLGFSIQESTGLQLCAGVSM